MVTAIRFLPVQLLLIGTLVANPVVGQENVLASVEGYAITKPAAIRMLKRSYPVLFQPSDVQPGGWIQSQEIENLLPIAVEGLIAQRVVYQYLAQQKIVAGQAEIELEFDQLQRTLANQGQTIDQFLQAEGVTRAEIEYEIAWKLVWNRFLRQTLTEEYLEQHYLRNRRQFDGSEMRVAHLLIPAVDPVSQEQAFGQAKQLAERMGLPSADPNWLSWEEGVLRYSAAPTRTSGGEIGWIRFHEPMPVEFSQAAFQLRPDQISQPVKTPFGIHLIKCLELNEGKMGWKDVREGVQQDAANQLFNRIAEQHRPSLQITPLSLF